jgi:hypothetical protein
MQSSDDNEDNDRAFNFDEMVANARIGYADLSERRTTILASIESLTKEVTVIEDQIKRLATMLTALGVPLEESLARPRAVGVSQLTERIVRETFEENPSAVMSEAVLITRVKQASPGMIEKSIQGALYKLFTTGKLTRHGKRGSYSYSAVETDPVVEADPDGLPPSKPVYEIGGGPDGGSASNAGCG